MNNQASEQLNNFKLLG